MKLNSPALFVEINDSEYVFTAIGITDGQSFSVIEKVTTIHNTINSYKIINVLQAQEKIKKNIKIIESKLNHVFEDVIVILGSFKFSCNNISGSKKLNGSQVLKENISYILNSLKSTIIENEDEKTILHIFNSKSILDGVHVQTLPIGLFGNFYNHELSFLLIQNSDLKNIKKIFYKNNLNIKKILIKKFIEGTQLIEQNDNLETFFKIKINKNNSSIIFFDQSSLKFIEYFDFGTNIILQDIQKVCSINKEVINKILDEKVGRNLKENEVFSENCFPEGRFKKIEKKLIKDIAKARIEEIIKIIFNKNINIFSFKKKNCKIYLGIDDKQIIANFKDDFFSFLNEKRHFEISLHDGFLNDETTMRAANLSFFGWKKEAIPVTQIKNSLITRIFKSLFG